MKKFALLLLISSRCFAEEPVMQNGKTILSIEPGAEYLSHPNNSGNIYTADGHLVETLSKEQLICALYTTWLAHAAMTCIQAKQYGHSLPVEFCGEDLRLKAEACNDLTQ